MIIVNIIGGLGNQMFQYAFAYSVAKRTNQQLKLDISDFNSYNLHNYELDLFHINGDFATKKELYKLGIKKFDVIFKIMRRLRRLHRLSRSLKILIPLLKQHYFENGLSFDDNVFNVKGDTYFSGYWQSEKYFKDDRSAILKMFTLKEDANIKTKDYRQEILNTQSVSLHIRRGDYITNQETNNCHGVCSMAYYQKSINYIKTKESHFFIFSDDLNWAKANLDFINNKTFVELDKNIPDHEEMYLMSLCKHNIIANSSFSWWGAWLNQNEDKTVIAPEKWFATDKLNTSDLIPKNWICL